MFTRSIPARMRIILLFSLASLVPAAAHAVTFDGKIAWMEVWTTGNIAFSLTTGASGYCNSQFIVNYSWNGAKNMAALLLAAKAQDRPIRVYSSVDSTGCIAAEGYGGTYIRPDYIYQID
jgi:endo-beta-N-acetylglucosaminidase D